MVTTIPALNSLVNEGPLHFERNILPYYSTKQLCRLGSARLFERSRAPFPKSQSSTLLSLPELHRVKGIVRCCVAWFKDSQRNNEIKMNIMQLVSTLVKQGWGRRTSPRLQISHLHEVLLWWGGLTSPATSATFRYHRSWRCP